MKVIKSHVLHSRPIAELGREHMEGQKAEGRPKQAAEPKEQFLMMFSNLIMKKPLFKQSMNASMGCASPKI